MTAHDDGIFTSPSLLVTDFGDTADVCRRLGAALTAGGSVELRAPGGTDLRFDLCQRPHRPTRSG